MKKTVLVPLAQGCEELEAVTIIDLLVRADIEVVTASLDNERVITASRGVQLVAQMTLEQALQQDYDMVVLPGGLPGADYLNADIRVLQKLQQTVDRGGIAAAICAAPKVLQTAGLLDNKQVTSYPGALQLDENTKFDWLDQAVVEDGAIITSRGPGTAMDFALLLIAKLQGDEMRQTVERALVRA